MKRHLFSEADELALRQCVERIVADRTGSRSLVEGVRRRRIRYIGSYDCDLITVHLSTGDEFTLFLKDYRATMIQLLRVSCDLEQALLESRFDDGRRIFESELRALQKPSHERFRDED